MSGPHPSHKTRISMDASSFDEICTLCGATDIAGGGWGRLAHPCPKAEPVVYAVTAARAAKPTDDRGALAALLTHLRMAEPVSGCSWFPAAIAAMERIVNAEPDCMEAEHGAHPTCPHMEETIATMRAERERDTAAFVDARDELADACAEMAGLVMAVSSITRVAEDRQTRLNEWAPIGVRLRAMALAVFGADTRTADEALTEIERRIARLAGEGKIDPPPSFTGTREDFIAIVEPWLRLLKRDAETVGRARSFIGRKADS